MSLIEERVFKGIVALSERLNAELVGGALPLLDGDLSWSVIRLSHPLRQLGVKPCNTTVLPGECSAASTRPYRGCFGPITPTRIGKPARHKLGAWGKASSKRLMPCVHEKLQQVPAGVKKLSAFLLVPPPRVRWVRKWATHLRALISKEEHHHHHHQTRSRTFLGLANTPKPDDWVYIFLQIYVFFVQKYQMDECIRIVFLFQPFPMSCPPCPAQPNTRVRAPPKKRGQFHK